MNTNTQKFVGSTVISLLVSDKNLHHGPGDSRAEIIIKTESTDYWPDPVWIGDPEKADRALLWVFDMLRMFPCEEHERAIDKIWDALRSRKNRSRFGMR